MNASAPLDPLHILLGAGVALISLLFSIVAYFLVRFLHSIDDRFQKTAEKTDAHEARLNRHGRVLAALRALVNAGLPAKAHVPAPEPEGDGE